jgi:SAM-dependent methyltransferase
MCLRRQALGPGSTYPEPVLAITTLVDERILICPRCGGAVVHVDDSWRCSEPSCPHAGVPFMVVAGTPVLVDFERSVLSEEKVQASGGASLVARPDRPGIVKRMLHPTNDQAPRIAEQMVALLLADVASTGRRPRILVIGGGTIGSGLEALYADDRVDLIAFDVYTSVNVQLVADGHRVPLADGTVDGVIIQAVLEHVLEPVVVVGEIRRVLREGGVVYADTPFMQQVHEGPYDFTRFTESGHRYLFRDFEQVESGQVAGAGTSLRWAINYFFRALTRSVVVGRIAGLAFFWLSHLDRFLDPRHSLDGANSVYFLGRKGGPGMSPPQAIQHYQGGM